MRYPCPQNGPLSYPAACPRDPFIKDAVKTCGSRGQDEGSG